MKTRNQSVAALGLSLIAVIAPLAATSAPATATVNPPVIVESNRGTSPLRVPTSGGVELFLFSTVNVQDGATATFSSYDPQHPSDLGYTVEGIPVTVVDGYTAKVLAPPMPVGPAKIALLNPGSASSVNSMTVTYGDHLIELNIDCTETSIPLNANVGDYVKLIPTGACLSARDWSVGAIGNITSVPQSVPTWERAINPLSRTGSVIYSSSQTGAERAEAERGQWSPVVGSDWSQNDQTWNGGYNNFTDNPNGIVLQVNAGTVVGNKVAFVYQHAWRSSEFQYPIVYAGGRIEPVVPPAPAPAPTAEPIVVPTVAPVVIPTTAPTAAPVELPAGTGGALINGVSTPVTVAAALGGNAVVVSAGGVTVEVGGTAPDGTPLPLAPDGSLIVAESGGVEMGGAGFSPNSTVSLFLYSTPTKLGELPVSATGSYSGSALIPAGIEAGSHTIQAVGYTPSGETLALSVGVTVKSAAAIRGANPVVRASAAARTAGAQFVASASGVQSRCTVRFWTKGSSATVKAGVAGRAQASLTAPKTPGTWVVTATVSGDGCERQITKSTYKVGRS